MSIVSEIFSWWGGNTWGTRWTIWRHGRFVGSDPYGNKYYRQRRGIGPLGVPRRWVVYPAQSEPSQVPPGWHAWLHHTVDTIPDETQGQPRPWQRSHAMNMTGTAAATRPKGSILVKAGRPRATGDYRPWRPDV